MENRAFDCARQVERVSVSPDKYNKTVPGQTWRAVQWNDTRAAETWT